MATVDSAIARGSSLGLRSALPLFAATLFLSAFLLFSIQPFFAKMVLPRLGGSPAVWSVAMVFFQSMLLLGYAYAHLLTKQLTLRGGAILHVAVLASAFLVLPIAIPTGWEQPPDSGQAIWLLGLFAVSVGLPFFAVSASAPLLQAWFSRTGHPHAADPYFLYGASNIGSFASLILFIVFFEPLFTVSGQSAMWTAGFAALAVLICACMAIVIGAKKQAVSEPAAAARDEATTAGGPLRWALLASVPSGLLVAVTAHISVDVAAAPFLWVIPLALFLLTFVITFRRRPIVTVSSLSKLLPYLGGAAVVSIVAHSVLPIWANLSIHLVFFLVAALFCHARLFELRPPASRLTAFYLWMSFGGVLGGVFASLIAPLVFDWIAEYLLLIIAVMFFRPELWRGNRADIAKFALIAVVVGVAILFVASFDRLTVFNDTPRLALAMITFAVGGVVIQYFSQPGFMLTMILLAPLGFLHAVSGGDLFNERTFFGVVKVSETADGRFRKMTHGTTLHGAMEVRDVNGAMIGGRPEPLTYYHRSGGIAAALRAVQERHGGAIGHGGVVGLGAGSILCHTKPGETWTAFEIDRSVVDAAADPKLFRFMSECGAGAPVILGDARLSLEKVPDRSFDFLLVDAFSSDSIPVHLMTREAVRLYMSKIKADGVIAMHISNRYLELESVLAAIAAEEGLAMRAALIQVDEVAKKNFVATSNVVVLARDASLFGNLNDDPRWHAGAPNGTRAWTDDFSDVFTALLRKL